MENSECIALRNNTYMDRRALNWKKKSLTELCPPESQHVFRRWSDRISAGTPAIMTEVFRGFPQTHHANYGRVPRLDHDRILPNPYQFIYSTIRNYIFSILKASLNNNPRGKKTSTAIQYGSSDSRCAVVSTKHCLDPSFHADCPAVVSVQSAKSPQLVYTLAAARFSLQRKS
jgi:hypothetical protein